MKQLYGLDLAVSNQPFGYKSLLTALYKSRIQPKTALLRYIIMVKSPC